MKKLLMGTLLGATAIAYAQVDWLPAGTSLEVRTNEGIDLRDASNGRIYSAEVARDVIDRDGGIAIRRGARAELIVRNIGRREMAVDLESIEMDGRRYAVDSETRVSTERQGLGENKRTGEYVGGGALFGSIIGAIAGGGKGAAIGAIAGAGAGAGAQVATRGERVWVPAETVLRFRLNQPLRLAHVPDNGYMRDGQHYHDSYDRRDNGPDHR